MPSTTKLPPKCPVAEVMRAWDCEVRILPNDRGKECPRCLRAFDREVAYSLRSLGWHFVEYRCACGASRIHASGYPDAA